MEKEQVNFIKEHKISLTIKGKEYKRHFSGDKEPRWVFTCTLKANGRQYTFKFGQSYYNGEKAPELEDVLACLTKYDVGDFNNFCAEFGYDEWERDSKKIYKAVLREFRNVHRLFGDDTSQLGELFN